MKSKLFITSWKHIKKVSLYFKRSSVSFILILNILVIYEYFFALLYDQFIHVYKNQSWNNNIIYTIKLGYNLRNENQ